MIDDDHTIKEHELTVEEIVAISKEAGCDTPAEELLNSPAMEQFRQTGTFWVTSVPYVSPLYYPDRSTSGQFSSGGLLG